jgi:para-aminobenzoate synthetase/4-amino-4-deoxychorismate lyase
LRYENGTFYLLDRHLERMAASADYFDFPFDADTAHEVLNAAIRYQPGPLRVRLLWPRFGHPRVECQSLAPITQPLRVTIAESPIDSSDVFLFHKTTHRAIYDAALHAHPGCDEVLLCNEQDQIAEGCWSNVVVTLDGRHYTPPVACGLLAGCMRAELLARGEIEERVIARNEIARAERLRMINSVRGWMEATLTH